MRKRILIFIFVLSLFLNLYGYSAIEIIPEIVRNAVDIVEKNGEEGFSVFYDRNGGFFYQDQYIFVNREDGTILVDVAFREIEGTLPADLKDSFGTYILVGNQNTALNFGEGWFSYYWPKPGKTDESRKSVFVKKAEYEGKVYVVGMGYISAWAVYMTCWWAYDGNTRYGAQQWSYPTMASITGRSSVLISACAAPKREMTM